MSASWYGEPSWTGFTDYLTMIDVELKAFLDGFEGKDGAEIEVGDEILSTIFETRLAIKLMHDTLKPLYEKERTDEDQRSE